jgi:hypothetical protein
MTLVVFVLTFIVSVVVVFYILFYVLSEVLGYGLFPGEQAPPDWLDPISYAPWGVSLALASFSGWRFWRGRPPWWRAGRAPRRGSG